MTYSYRIWFIHIGYDLIIWRVTHEHLKIIYLRQLCTHSNSSTISKEKKFIRNNHWNLVMKWFSLCRSSTLDAILKRCDVLRIHINDSLLYHRTHVSIHAMFLSMISSNPTRILSSHIVLQTPFLLLANAKEYRSLTFVNWGGKKCCTVDILFPLHISYFPPCVK